jgi:peptide/nickel transport system substrate-binding protein
MASLDAELFDRVKAGAAAQTRDLGMSLDNEMLWFNQAPHAPISSAKKTWFADPAFRKAISLAINRQDLARLVYKGYAQAASGAISPANQFWADSAAKAPVQDLEAAKKLLTSRGYKPGEIEFSIVTNAGNKARERMAALIQQDLAKIGVKVTVAPLEFPSLIERIMKTANYDACLLGQVITDLDPLAQKNVWVSSGNLHAWNPLQKTPATAWEAEIDKQIETVETTADPRKRKAAFDRVQRILAEQEPALYLVFKHGLAAANPKVGNLRPSVLRPQLLWNAAELYLKP